jgi:hypothetical protein
LNPIFKWTVIALASLIVAGFIFLCLMAGGPRDALSMVRYAFPHMHRGTLKVGDEAPDARLIALDGTTNFHIREKTAGRPLVLVFGSFT